MEPKRRHKSRTLFSVCLTTMADLIVTLSIILIAFLNRGILFSTIGAVEYTPVARTTEHRYLEADDRRMLAEPFQLCLDCRCCVGDDTSNCSTMPCCFGIECNLPEKPFGVCAFVPKTCNCTSCD